MVFQSLNELNQANGHLSRVKVGRNVERIILDIKRSHVIMCADLHPEPAKRGIAARFRVSDSGRRAPGRQLSGRDGSHVPEPHLDDSLRVER